MDTFLRCQILNILIFLSKYAHSFIRIFIQNFDKISRRRAAALQRIRLSVNKCYGTKTEKYFSTFKTILGLFTSENSQCVSTNCCCCCRLDPDNAFQPKYWYKHLLICQPIATLYSDLIEWRKYYKLPLTFLFKTHFVL